MPEKAASEGHSVFWVSLGALTSSRSLELTNFPPSPGFQALSIGNSYFLILLQTSLDRLIVGDRNFSPLQENRKGEKTGIKEGKRILMTNSVEGRESHDLRSDLTKGPESPPWSLVPHPPKADSLWVRTGAKKQANERNPQQDGTDCCWGFWIWAMKPKKNQRLRRKSNRTSPQSMCLLLPSSCSKGSGEPKKPEIDFNPENIPLSEKTPSTLFLALLFSNIYLLALLKRSSRKITHYAKGPVFKNRLESVPIPCLLRPRGRADDLALLPA